MASPGILHSQSPSSIGGTSPQRNRNSSSQDEFGHDTVPQTIVQRVGNVQNIRRRGHDDVDASRPGQTHSGIASSALDVVSADSSAREARLPPFSPFMSHASVLPPHPAQQFVPDSGPRHGHPEPNSLATETWLPPPHSPFTPSRQTTGPSFLSPGTKHLQGAYSRADSEVPSSMSLMGHNAAYSQSKAQITSATNFQTLSSPQFPVLDKHLDLRRLPHNHRGRQGTADDDPGAALGVPGGRQFLPAKLRRDAPTFFCGIGGDGGHGGPSGLWGRGDADAGRGYPNEFGRTGYEPRPPVLVTSPPQFQLLSDPETATFASPPAGLGVPGAEDQVPQSPLIPLPVRSPMMEFPIPVRVRLLGQLEYYLSPRNMASDFYLRQRMDSRGWLPISLIASFNRVRRLTTDETLVKDLLAFSSTVEVMNDHVRMVGWEQFVPADAAPSAVEGIVAISEPSVEELEEHDEPDEWDTAPSESPRTCSGHSYSSACPPAC